LERLERFELPFSYIHRILRLQRLVEVVDGALPGEFRRFCVITRCRIVMEAVIRSGIHISLVLYAARLEGGLVFGPPAVDVGVLLGKVKQQSGLDLWHVLNRRRGAIKRNSGRELRHPDSQPVDHTAAKTEAHSTELAGGLWML
jgi:hypothetical protein